MPNAWKIAVAIAALPARVPATEPASVQDPPGEVDVSQPAGVTREERNTAADTTDTLSGGGRTEVTRGGDDVAQGVDARASSDRSDVEPGAEARTGFEPGTSPREESPSPRDDEAGTAQSTSLGTDTGHGTGTEAEAPPPAKP
jgi:hypothetical protein